MADDALEYLGPEKLPRWWKEGAYVRVKSTPWTRPKTGNGIHCRKGWASGDTCVWAGEIGKISVETGRETWKWAIEFDRGRTVVVHGMRPDDLKDFVRYVPKK